MYISKTILFIAGLLIAVFILFTCNHLDPPAMQDETDQVVPSEWINDAGDIVSSLTGREEAFARAKKEVMDSLAKVYFTKPKNVVEYIILETQGTTDVKPDGPTAADYFPVDTNKKDCPPQIKNLRQEFTNPYYKAFVQVGDSSFMHLQSFDTVTVLWKKVTEGNIFHRKHLIQLDVSTANPDTKVSGLKAYRINEKPKRWVIGFSAGYGFGMKGIPQYVPFVGLTLTKTIIRF